MLDHSTSFIYPPGVEEAAYTVQCLQQMVATNQWPQQFSNCTQFYLKLNMYVTYNTHVQCMGTFCDFEMLHYLNNYPH